MILLPVGNVKVQRNEGVSEEISEATKGIPRYSEKVECPDRNTAFILAILFGLFGFRGIGYVYMKELQKGVPLLCASIAMIGLYTFSMCSWDSLRVEG